MMDWGITVEEAYGVKRSRSLMSARRVLSDDRIWRVRGLIQVMKSLAAMKGGHGIRHGLCRHHSGSLRHFLPAGGREKNQGRASLQRRNCAS